MRVPTEQYIHTLLLGFHVWLMDAMANQGLVLSVHTRKINICLCREKTIATD